MCQLRISVPRETTTVRVAGLTSTKIILKTKQSLTHDIKIPLSELCYPKHLKQYPFHFFDLFNTS